MIGTLYFNTELKNKEKNWIPAVHGNNDRSIAQTEWFSGLAQNDKSIYIEKKGINNTNHKLQLNPTFNVLFILSKFISHAIAIELNCLRTAKCLSKILRIYF